MTNTSFAIGGSQTPDQKCQAERPADVTNAMALVATTSRAAAAVLDMTATYVRSDGTVVGTGALIASGGTLGTGIWQSADLVYRFIGSARVWTGQANLTSVGTTAGTCGNWLDTTLGAGNQGYPLTTAPTWWASMTSPCTDVGALYCVQVP